MTDRELLQKALEALKENDYWHIQHDEHDGYSDSRICDINYAAIKEIEARLAEPEKEHVGYLLINKENDLCLSRIRTWVTEFGLPDNEYNLYIHPQPERKPLSEDEIMNLTVGRVNPLGGIYASSIIDFARAIERELGAYPTTPPAF